MKTQFIVNEDKDVSDTGETKADPDVDPKEANEAAPKRNYQEEFDALMRASFTFKK